jgi:hypothetical protein
MKLSVTKPKKIFDQASGFGGIRNILGICDPQVVKINEQWWMFFGGFQTNFKNNIFTASLPRGETLSSNKWSITTVEGNPKKAKSIVDLPSKGEWDEFGYHTPCYVEGKNEKDEWVERIYYAGRGSNKTQDNDVPYSIGAIEKKNNQWIRRPSMILKGSNEKPNVLEPKARYFDGKWRIWYAATAQEAGKNSDPNYCIKYVESLDGISNWSTPKMLFDEDENFYDASVHSNVESGYEMVTSRSTNLYGKKEFEAQGLWLLKSEVANGNRHNWTTYPVQILDADRGDDWYSNGVNSPSCHYGETTQDKESLYIFFSSVQKERNWMKWAFNNLKKGKRPPFHHLFILLLVEWN